MVWKTTTKSDNQEFCEHTLYQRIVLLRKPSKTIRISFNSQQDKYNGFFELIHESGSGFMGVGKNEFIVNQNQCKLLRDKNINFTEINNR